jgi:hypothetical protein
MLQFAFGLRREMYGHPETLFFTARLACRMIERGILGDFVECGVYKGVHPAVMAHVIQEMEPASDRRVWLYDSFQGIPEAGPNDQQWPGLGEEPGRVKSGALKTTDVAACSLSHVRSNMSRWGVRDRRLVYREGWFQHTVGLDRPPRIALLRLDGDLYESTKVCLEALYPVLMPGGVLIIDDYPLPGCRQAVDEYFDRKVQFQQVLGYEDGPAWTTKAGSGCA